MHLGIQSQRVPLPSSNVKSKKENRPSPIATVSPRTNAVSTPTVRPDRIEHRHSPHASLGLPGMSFGTVASSASFSRTPQDLHELVSDSPQATFGGVTNEDPLLGSLCCQTGSVTPSSDSTGQLSSDKGTKRSRHFTSASARAIDDEDEPRRPTPRLRHSPLATKDMESTE